ncbi:MAG: V-type ATP synthase subunit F [Actinomycetota bacterium]|nr:V-type ATP synthase subunit F [Actinomycetota bacterium]
MTMHRIAVVGDAASVAGFRALGFEVFAVQQAGEARDLWPRVAGGTHAIVFVTEPVFEAVADLAAESTDLPIPAVTVIPGAGSPGGVGQHKIDRAIERALGTTALIREEDS